MAFLSWCPPETKRKTREKGHNLRSQKVSIVLARDLAGEVLGGKVVLVPRAGLGGELVGALLEQLESVGFGDLLALGSGAAVTSPLPELRARNLGGCGVLPTNPRVSCYGPPVFLFLFS